MYMLEQEDARLARGSELNWFCLASCSNVVRARVLASESHLARRNNPFVGLNVAISSA